MGAAWERHAMCESALTGNMTRPYHQLSRSSLKFQQTHLTSYFEVLFTFSVVSLRPPTQEILGSFTELATS